jgi:ankyrin repeat protein
VYLFQNFQHSHCYNYFSFSRCFNQKFVAGTDVDLTTDGGRTALHYAASKGRLNIAEKLIAHGAKVNKKDMVCPPYILV